MSERERAHPTLGAETRAFFARGVAPGIYRRSGWARGSATRRRRGFITRWRSVVVMGAMTTGLATRVSIPGRRASTDACFI
jgi:hypothetical protein